VNIIDSNGWTALHHAAYNGDLLAVKLLVGAKAHINAFSNQFKTPLHFAAMNNHSEVVDYLINSWTGVNDGIPLNQIHDLIEAKDE